MAVGPKNYAMVKRWRKANPEKVAAQARRYRARYPERIKAIKAKHRHNNLAKIREQDAEYKKLMRADKEKNAIRIKRFREKQERLLEDLAGRRRPEICELCGEKAKTVFDHCHKTGAFRGWLCNRCNRVLGSVKDDWDLLTAMAVYLKTGGSKHGEVNNGGKECNFIEGICTTESSLPN